MEISKQNGVAAAGDGSSSNDADKSIYLFIMASQTYSTEQVNFCLNQITSCMNI